CLCGEPPSPGAIQQLKRAFVLRLWPYRRVKPGDCFHVVVQYVGQRVKDNIESELIPPEVRNQHLNSDAGARRPDLANRLRKDLGASVVEFIPVYRGDHRMPQSQERDGLRYAAGFVGIEFLRLSGFHRAESA